MSSANTCVLPRVPVRGTQHKLICSLWHQLKAYDLPEGGLLPAWRASIMVYAGPWRVRRHSQLHAVNPTADLHAGQLRPGRIQVLTPSLPNQKHIATNVAGCQIYHHASETVRPRMAVSSVGLPESDG